ncbi:DUF4377 domain-containing protein [Nocardia panacis]|nr:DUF4377 domain-containing protein [Nocardia panacis]
MRSGRYALPVASIALATLVGGCSHPAPAERATAPTSSAVSQAGIDLWVGPRPCADEPTCLQVKQNPDSTWEPLREGIAGFTYQPGFVYQLKVAAAAAGWRLIAIVRRDPAD